MSSTDDPRREKPLDPQDPGATKASARSEDLTGRDRIASNVLYSWAGHLVFIAAGFVMPRMIDHHVGQFSLGIWDFCWSFVHYLTLASLGVGSSVNRYVAKYRAAGDTEGLRKTLSSVFCIQLAIAGFIFAATAVLTWAMPLFFGDRLGEEVTVARWVVGLLGVSLGVEMAFDSFRGIMTGSHRWDLHNGINATSRAVEVAVMIGALSLGGGLRSLGIAHLAIVFTTELVRMGLAFRVCPELTLRFRYAEWPQAKKMLLFGCKVVVASIPALVLVQSTNVLVVTFIGPAALAVFSRPISLVRHVKTFVNKFSYVLTPTAGSLQGCGKGDEIRQFLVDTTRFGVALTLPMILFLSIYGDLILRAWMGPDYESGVVLIVFAAGYLLPISQHSTMRILIGMNLHGRVASVALATAAVSFLVGAGVVHLLGWTLLNAAFLVAIPITLSEGVVVPVYACRKVGVPLLRFVRETLVVPVLCGIAFTVPLVSSRILFPDAPLTAFLTGGCTGGFVLGALYWLTILPDRLREKITTKVKRRFGPGRSPAEGRCT